MLRFSHQSSPCEIIWPVFSPWTDIYRVLHGCILSRNSRLTSRSCTVKDIDTNNPLLSAALHNISFEEPSYLFQIPCLTFLFIKIYSALSCKQDTQIVGEASYLPQQRLWHHFCLLANQRPSIIRVYFQLIRYELNFLPEILRTSHSFLILSLRTVRENIRFTPCYEQQVFYIFFFTILLGCLWPYGANYSTC